MQNSSPEYMALRVDVNGKGTYDSHQLKDPPSPRPLQLSTLTTERIYSLVQDLDNLHSVNLESRHQVANMGLKTLTYEAGNVINRVQYNYTENRAGQQLTEIFEKISNVEERISQLEYDMKYDHLSLPETLSNIQEGLQDHSYVEPTLMIPILEKITSNSRFLHLAQSRAQDIMQFIQRSK